MVQRKRGNSKVDIIHAICTEIDLIHLQKHLATTHQLGIQMKKRKINPSHQNEGRKIALIVIQQFICHLVLIDSNNKLLILRDFPTHLSLRLAEKGLTKINYLVNSSSQDQNDMLNTDITGEWMDLFEVLSLLFKTDACCQMLEAIIQRIRPKLVNKKIEKC